MQDVLCKGQQLCGRWKGQIVAKPHHMQSLARCTSAVCICTAKPQAGDSLATRLRYIQRYTIILRNTSFGWVLSFAAGGSCIGGQGAHSMKGAQSQIAHRSRYTRTQSHLHLASRIGAQSGLAAGAASVVFVQVGLF